jgi:hypothetical protein
MADDNHTEPTEAAGAAPSIPQGVYPPQRASSNPHSAIRNPHSQLYELFLEQQRRLACPGCGEEEFLG